MKRWLMKVISDAKEDIALQTPFVKLADRYKKNYDVILLWTFVHKIVDKGFATTYRKGKSGIYSSEKSCTLSAIFTATPESEKKSETRRVPLYFWGTLYLQPTMTHTKKSLLLSFPTQSLVSYTLFYLAERSSGIGIRTCGNRRNKGIPPDHRPSGRTMSIECRNIIKAYGAELAPFRRKQRV